MKNKRKYYFFGFLTVAFSGLFLLFNNFSGHSKDERRRGIKSIHGLSGLVPAQGERFEEKDNYVFWWADEYLKANIDVTQSTILRTDISERGKIQACTAGEFEGALRAGQGTIVINCDIDFQNKIMDPIPTFAGEIWGNNHLILNLNIVQKNGTYGGFFNQFSGKIQSLKFKNSRLLIQPMDSNLSAVGFLAGHLEAGSEIRNISFINSNLIVSDDIATDPLILGFVIGESFAKDSKMADVQAADVVISMNSDRKLVFGQALGLGFVQMDQLNLKTQIEIKDKQYGGHLTRRIVGFPLSVENKNILVTSKIKINQEATHE